MSTWWFPWKSANTKLLSFDAWNVWDPLFTNKNLGGKKIDCKFRTISLRDRHVARSLEASLRTSDEKISSLESQCHEGHFHAILRKIGSNFEDHWQLKIMKIHFISISSYSSPFFWMDISHLRFGRGQVLCSRGSWQGQGWKSIQRCLMLVLCPMLAKCWHIFGTPFAGVAKGESEFLPLVNRRRDCLNISYPQILCRVFFFNILLSMLPNTFEFYYNHIISIDRWGILYIYISPSTTYLLLHPSCNHQTPCVSHLFPGPEGGHRWAGGDASWCPCRASGIPSGREAADAIGFFVGSVGWKSDGFFLGRRENKTGGKLKTHFYILYIHIYIYIYMYIFVFTKFFLCSVLEFWWFLVLDLDGYKIGVLSTHEGSWRLAWNVFLPLRHNAQKAWTVSGAATNFLVAGFTTQLHGDCIRS